MYNHHYTGIYERERERIPSADGYNTYTELFWCLERGTGDKLKESHKPQSASEALTPRMATDLCGSCTLIADSCHVQLSPSPIQLRGVEKTGAQVKGQSTEPVLSLTSPLSLLPDTTKRLHHRAHN